MPARILVVEDAAAVAELVEAVLSEEGYTVAVAPDGTVGLVLARDWRPDLILMDVQLPKLNGATLIHRLKQDPETGGIPIVTMSAAANILSQIEELSEADGTLTKPFAIEALLNAVAFHLARSASQE